MWLEVTSVPHRAWPQRSMRTWPPLVGVCHRPVGSPARAGEARAAAATASAVRTEVFIGVFLLTDRRGDPLGGRLIRVSVGNKAELMKLHQGLHDLRSSYPPISVSHSSSLRTLTPCFSASFSLDPAPGPATT